MVKRMQTISDVFKQTYHHYLEQIQSLSFETIAGPLGARFHNGILEIDIFNEPYTISKDGILDRSLHQPGFDICVILSRYLVMCPEGSFEKNRWVSFRDFKDSGPLTTYFANDIETYVARHFSGRTAELKKAAESLGGYPAEIDVTYDLVFRFNALPEIGMILLFNDADDEFKAGCSILFESRTEKYLDAECIAMLGWQLVHRLRR